jgi:kumamolisin
MAVLPNRPNHPNLPPMTSARHGHHRVPPFAIAALLAIAAVPAFAASTGAHAVPLAGSFREVPSASALASPAPRHARIARTSLRTEEMAAPMSFEVALRMRNFDELQSRVARGEQVPDEEKKTRYFPTESDHAAVVAWLRSQGLEVTRTDENRLAVFGRGSVRAVAEAFGVSVARVATDDGEFTSAVSAPSVPADIAGSVLGVHGLQPHLRPHVLGMPRVLTPALSTSPPYYPAQIAHTYNADQIGTTGAGQTIAVYAYATPASSDLTAFWSATSSTATLSNIQTVNVTGGPTAPSSGFLEEATLDVEWASAMAPGATIRVYAADENDPANNDEIFQQVYADISSQPNLHILNVCIGGNELEVEHDYLIIEAQYLANLASSGVTVLVASGDNGASPNGVLQATYPTTDPSVTGVGGTTLTLSTSLGDVLNETAWTGSGGGASVVFSRPSWQTGTGVPTGTMRLSPDVAAAANPNYGAVLYYSGTQTVIGGTSWATPIWAGFCALINEYRSRSGLAAVGFLNPALYALNGSASIRDITSGSNGAYHAGMGYDLCTGLGVPNVLALANASLSPTYAPVVTGSLGSRSIVAGQPAVFSVAAFGAAPLSYQWQRLASGGATWTNLTDNATYSGTATQTLVINPATVAMSGTQYQCQVTNARGSALSAPPCTLTVNLSGVTTLAGWPGAAGAADAAGWSARFRYPGGVRTDSSGNVYVADSMNNTVRKITPAGVVTTYAGVPYTAGSRNGPAGGALFNGIGGVAPDASGNVYVADSGNYLIRKISGGSVSTYAGTGVSGTLNGTLAGAEFYDPQNLAVDSTGNVYVADGAGNTIRKILTTGSVITLAGSGVAGLSNGSGNSARFNDPTGVAVDASGNVYVADSGNNEVRKITPSGAVSLLAGSASGAYGSADGTGSSARFYKPSGVAVDGSGNVYVTDSYNNTVRMITPAGVVTTIAGAAGVAENTDGLAAAARFYTPGDIAVDASGVLYVADTYNMTIRRIVTGSLAAPAITAGPQSTTIGTGGSVTLSVAATGSGTLTYQWYLNGTAIPGATSPTLTLTSLAASQAGSYTVTVTGVAGTATSSPAVLTVSTNAELTNLSARASVGTGGNILIAGLGVGGTGTKHVLVRGVGPGLAATFGLAGTLAQPELVLFDGASTPQVIASDSGWANPPATGPSAVPATVQSAGTAAMSAVGAFSLATASADSALVAGLPTGSYTAQVIGLGASPTGIALAELYDTDTGTPTARLINISARASVGTAGNILIGGFTIAGTSSETVLIRGVGPGLSSTFGLTGVLATPQLVLYDGAGTPQVVASNTGWATSPTAGPSAVTAGILPATASVMAQVGAFSLVSGSADCAMLVTLPPGGYTAQLSGVGGTTGIGLIEIYEVR